MWRALAFAMLLLGVGGCVRASSIVGRPRGDLTGDLVAPKEGGGLDRVPEPPRDAPRPADGARADLALPDQASPDRAPPDKAPICPVGMSQIGPSSCMDVNHAATKTWVGAAAFCMVNDKRLCTDSEWSAACAAPAGIQNLVEVAGEWVGDLAGADGKIRGAGSCAATGSAPVAATLLAFRCCWSASIDKVGMADLGAYWIEQSKGPQQPWQAAASSCMAKGRRLCQAVEWEGACAVATAKGLVNMLSGWEWLATVSGSSADKHGTSTCTTSGSAGIANGYATRCCY